MSTAGETNYIMSVASLISGIMPSGTPIVGAALLMASALGALPDFGAPLLPSMACVCGAVFGGPTLVSVVVGCILTWGLLMRLGTM